MKFVMQVEPLDLNFKPLTTKFSIRYNLNLTTKDSVNLAIMLNYYIYPLNLT
jgi:hypothetical protein